MRRHKDGFYEVSVRSDSSVDPATAYQLLTTGASWPLWSPVTAFRLEKNGVAQAEGPGAIRMFRISLAFVPVACRQRVVECLPQQTFRYALAAGLPMRDYHGNVDLDPDPVAGGARVHWHSTFRPMIPGSGPLCAFMLERFIRDCVTGLAAHAPARDAPRTHGAQQ